jgi:hypothetical protein
MKRSYVYVLNFALVGVFVLIGVVSVFSQKTVSSSYSLFSEELRPFDFSDKYYYENGIEPLLLVNRRDGMDKQSVFDTIEDPRFRDVRILSVYPAYNQDGKIVYWNLYGEFFKEGFLNDPTGERAVAVAHMFPLYVFPSASAQGELRQAHLIDMRDSYFEKNPLGLSAQVVVEFTDRINTEDGRLEMAALAARNGVSTDGTPIIKTALEIEDLTQKNYVTQKLKGIYGPAQPSYAVAKVMRDPQRGAIAPDAFLMNDLGLAAEKSFVEQFECLQMQGRWCAQ